MLIRVLSSSRRKAVSPHAPLDVSALGSGIPANAGQPAKLPGQGRSFRRRNIDADVLLNWRLAPDMFPLVRQVQIAADFAKGTPARLAGIEVPKFPDEE